MAKLIWDSTGDRYYETGVKQGVLYPQSDLGTYPNGVSWSGLTGITESPSGAEATPIFADDIKYLSLTSAEEFGATIEAYTYPDEFAICDGSLELGTGVVVGQQKRKTFGLCYRTTLGNDVSGNDYGYKIHIIYGATAAPSEKAYATINDSPEAITFSWTLTTIPVSATGFKPTATIVIDSSKVDADGLASLEDILLGSASTDARLPLPDEIISVINGAGPSSLTLSTMSPADDATGVSTDASVVLTFNNKVETEAVSLVTNSGVVVPFTKSWDVSRKVFTISPNTTLSSGETYLVTIAGVKDVYGSSLSTVVNNFTTA